MRRLRLHPTAAALPLLLLARVGHAQPVPAAIACAPTIELGANIPARVAQRLRRVLDHAVGALGPASPCAPSHARLDWNDRELTIHVSLDDGRIAVRSLESLEDVLPTMLSVLAVPPPDPAAADDPPPAPPTESPDTGELVITTNAANGSSVTVPLAANGAAPCITVNPDRLDFGPSLVGQATPRPVTITLPAPRGQVWQQRLTDDGPEDPGLVPGEAPFPDSLANVTAIARIAASLLGTPQPRPAPCYVRGADAAPPRDPPPVILP